MNTFKVFVILCLVFSINTLSMHTDTTLNVSSAENETSTLKPQRTCPVMGDEINKDLYVDAEGKRIYVCCEGCISTIKKDPDKYIKILEQRGESVLSLRPQETCPVMGGAINKSLYVDARGKRIYICCEGCIETVKKNPNKYIKLLESKGEIVESIKK